MFSRRDFLNTSLWAGAGLALGVHRAALAADGKGALPAGESLRTRAIPASGEQIPVVGAGTSGSFVAEIGSEKYQRLKEVMAIFFNSGATVFDENHMWAYAASVLEHRHRTSNVASHVLHTLPQRLSADHSDPEAMMIC